MRKNLFNVGVLIGIVFLSLNSHAQNKSTDDLLKLTGAALMNDERVSNYAVSVYLDGSKIDSVFIRNKRTLKFYVNYNKVYTFLYQKEGCVDKIIIVNTEVPEGLRSMTDDTFDFAIELSESLTKKSSELEDYPAAVLLIEKKEEVLQASSEYNRLTHKEEKMLK